MSDRRFETVLVGVDFSPALDALLSCLAGLADWGTRKLVLVHMVPVGYSARAGYGHEQEYLEDLEKRAALLREAGMEVETLVRDSSRPAVQFSALAAELGVDMVLVGSRSHNFVQRLFLGSFASEVIRGSTVPVLIQRIEKTGEATQDLCEAVCRNNLERVLLATDFSEQAVAAEEAALALATRAQRLDVLTVLPEKGGQEPPETRIEALRGRLGEIMPTGEVYTVTTGSPADTIIQFARQGYTLIVVGRHGSGRIASSLIGSTAVKVCEEAQRPVLLVPAGE